MSHQLHNGLISAIACARPATIPIGRPRGAKAAGVRYEKALAAALPSARRGQWWQYLEERGPSRWCQTDLLLRSGESLVVLEVKYTWTAEGHLQLERLYLPVVARATGRRAIGVVVAKRLLLGVSGIKICSSLDEAIETAKSGQRSVWHWMGVPSMARAA